MASVNAVIRVNIDASAANAGLQQMAAQMSRFNKGMVQGSASMAAAQVAAANRAQGALNRTGQWMASTGSVMTAAGRMHKQFDKGTMASWQQWRDTSKKNNLVNQMAAQRVRALQTQYVALGREVDGAQRVMKAQPTGMLRQWGAEAEFAHQKAVLLNRRMTMGANSMINWGKNTQWAGRQMMVGMGIPLGIAAMGAVKSYKEMETAAISFKRVYGDATTSAGEKAKMLGVIQNGVGQEMTKYGIAVADTVGIAAKAAATGQQGDKLVTATRETMRLATLGQMDYDTALQSTIATQTAFGVSQKGMVRTTDFLNAAENQTVLSMEDMAKAIPRVAPVIKGLGGDVEDLAVLMTALRAGGVTAEQGANALKSGLGSLINPTSGATEAMEKFGIPLDKIVKTNKGDLIGTVQDFGKALHELPKFEQQQALEALFGKYQYARMGALFNNINKDQARETARLSKDSSANLAKISEQEMSQISDSAMNKFQGAIERLKAAAAPLGESILGGLAPLVDGLSNVIGFFANNDAARNVALFAGAFAGLAGVGVMLTGVFANFFGTMMKGYLGLKNIGRRMMGRPSLAYSGLDELEASAAQRQLAAAAEGATASLYGEKGAVNQLTAALNAMNAELRESVGLKAAATGGVPASGAGRRTATSTAAAASAAGHPAALPVGSQSGRGASVITSAQRAHMTSPSNMSQLRSFYSNSANAKGYPGGETAFKAHATGVLSGNVHNGVVLRHGYDINRQQETGLVSRADAMGDTRMRGGAMFADIMAQVNDRKFSPADYAAMDKAAETYHSELAKMPATITPEDMGRATIAAVQKDLVGSGVMTQDQWDAMQRAQTVTAPTASGVGTSRQVLPGAEGNWRTALDNTKNKSVIDAVSANTHALDADGRAVMAHAGSVDGATKATKSDTEATEKATQSKRQGLSTEKDLKAAQDKHVAATEKVSKSQASLAAATDKQRLAQDEVLQRTKERDERKLAGKPILQAEKNLAASTKRLNLANQGVVKALSGRVAATQTLVGAEQGLAKATAAHTQATAAPTRGVSSPIALKGDPWGAPGKMSPSSRAAAERLTWKDPSANQRVSFPSSQRAGSGYNGLIQPGHFSNMMGSKREMLGGAMGGAWAGTKGFVGRMAGGGVFDRSPEKMDRMMGGLSNKLMGMGMAAEMVTMGLMMSGKEIPIWGHLLGTGLMTMGMFPEAVQKPIDMIKAGGSKVGALLAAFPAAGVALGGFALAAGALGANFLYHKKITDDAIQSGQDLANAMSVSSNEVSALGEQYGNQSIVEQKRAREAAKVAGTNVENMTEGQKALQSDVGKKILEDATKVMEASGIEESARTVANKLATANLQGTMDYKDTKGFLGAMGEENSVIASAARREYGKMVTSSKMVAEDPVGLALKLQETTNRSAMATATKIQSQARAQQEAYQAGGSYSSYSGMYGGGGGSGGNLAVDSPALGAINSKYAGFQGTIWSAGLEQQVTNREAAMIRLQDIERQMNDPSNTNAETSMLSKQFANGTEQLKKFDAQAQASWDNMKTTWGSTSEDGKNVMLSSMDQSARDRATDPMSQAMTEMGIQKMYDFRNNGDSTGEKITQDVQFRVTSALASGALNPDALTRMLDMGSAGANKIDLAISGTSSLNEAGDFFNKISSFKPGTFKDAVQGIGDGFIKAAKYAGMTQKEAIGLSKALGGSQADINAIKKAFQGDGVKGNPDKSRDNGNKDGKAYKDGAKNSSKGAKGDGVKGNPGKSKGEGNKDGKSYKDGANKSSKGAKGDGVKGNPGKSSGAGGKDGDAYTKAMMSKIKQISGVSVEPKVKVSTAGIGASIGAVASKAQNVKINYVPGDMPPPPDAVDQPINRVVAMDMSIIPPLPMTQMIMRFISFDMSTIPPFPMTQMIMRFVGFDASVIPPPPVTQLVIRKTVGGSVVGGPVGGFADGGDPFKRRSSKISGRGGPKDDLIPTMLSNGEFVIRASSVNKYGTGFMNKVNRGQIDRDVIPHLSTGDEAEDSKKKSKSKKNSKGNGSGSDNGDSKDKDTGWKDWTKEVKKLSKAWDKSSRLVAKSKPGNYALLASLFGTGSPNAIGKFKPGSNMSKKFAKQQKMESLQSSFNTLAEQQKLIKASKSRVKLLKKNWGLRDQINTLEAEELITAKNAPNPKKMIKRMAESKAKAAKAMQSQEYQSFADEQKAASDLNDLRIKLSQGRSDEEASAIMEMSDEELRQYGTFMKKTKGNKKDPKANFIAKRLAAAKRQTDFENKAAYMERSQSLAKETAFNNRVSDPNFKALSPSAAANLSQEDYEIMQTLSGTELINFQKALNDSAAAANSNSRALELLSKKAEYAAMTLGQQFQEGTELLNQKSQAMRDEQAAIGEQKIIEATGKTRNQLEAEIGKRGVEVSRFQHQQELEQRHMDDINEKYNEQAKLLDDISQAQQIISSLQRGRLSVASALSSGDIAAAAAAAQEQRASEAQASIDMMKSALEKERDDRLKEHQDRIDEAQDSIDTLNDQIFEYQHAMDSIAATYALIGADTSVNIDKLNTSLQAQSGYWAAVTKDIDEYINALNEINPDVFKLPGPSQTTDNNNNNNNNNNNEDNNNNDALPDDKNTPTPKTKLTKKEKRKAKEAKKIQAKSRMVGNSIHKEASEAASKYAKTDSKKDEKIADRLDKKNMVVAGKGEKITKLLADGKNNKAEQVLNKAAKIADVDLGKKKQDEDNARKKKADDDEKARQKKKNDDENNRKKQSQEAESQRKKKEEDNKKAQAQNKNKKNNGGFITKKYAGGGFVGGVGNTDKVPALLTPGEFVMTKGSAARYGKALEKVNSPSYKFASSAAGYSGGSAMGTSIYNLTVNAQTNADANDIATITIKRIQDMERTKIRERKV